MSDEEKKAIEWLKKADWFSARLYSTTILNLIEKQSKEIEELKKITNSYNSYSGNLMNDTRIIICDSRYFLNGTFVNKFVSKDKIKAKMKEKEWSLENYDCDESDYKQSQAIGAWSVLQSLLEKE